MKFVYFGSSEFSRIVLETIYLKGCQPSLIVSRADKPKKRGLCVLSTEVSLFAEDKKIPLIKSESLSDKSVEKALSKETADFFIVADYGRIIPYSLLKLPKVLPLCLHPSLLPLYRGPAPIEYALMNGDKITGVSIFKINAEVDAGDIALQKKIAIDYSDNFFFLRKKLAKIGAELLIETMNRIEAGKIILKPQGEAEAVFTFKLKKEDGRIDWDKRAQDIRNLIRATLGWPSAYSNYGKFIVKILSADVIKENTGDAPGTIINIGKEGIDVAASKNILRVKKIKPEGKNEMDAWSFVCGYRVKVGDKFL